MGKALRARSYQIDRKRVEETDQEEKDEEDHAGVGIREDGRRQRGEDGQGRRSPARTRSAG